MRILLVLFALFAASQAQVFNPSGILDKIKDELGHLKQIADAIKNGQDPKEIVKEALQRHPDLKAKLEKVCSIALLQKIEYVKKACDFLTENPQQRGLLGNVAGKFKEEFEHLKQIAQSLTQGKSPIEIIKQLIKTGKDKALAKVCGIKFVHSISFVDKACKALDDAGVVIQPLPLEPVDEAPVDEAPAATRGFKDAIGKLVQKFKEELAKLKEIAEKIKAGASPVDVLKEVVDQYPGLKPKLLAVCKINILHKIDFVEQACNALSEVPEVVEVPATQQRGLLTNVANKFKEELAKLKEIAQGKSPVAIIKELIKTGKDKALAKVCKIKFAQSISFVEKACKALGDAGVVIQPLPLEPVDVVEEPVEEPASPAATRGFTDTINKVTGAVKEELAKLKEIAEKLKNGASPLEVVKDIIQDHPAVLKKLNAVCNIQLLQHISFVQLACSALQQAAPADPAPAAATRGFSDLLNKITGTVKEELAHLREIVEKIKAGATPVEILKEIANDHPALKGKLIAVCKIQILHQIDYVEQACNALQEADPVATRGFGSFLSGIAQGPLNPFKKEVEGFKTLVELIKQKKSAGEIIKAIVDLGLQSRIISLCKVPVLSSLPFVGQACDFIEPLADQIAAFTG